MLQLGLWQSHWQSRCGRETNWISNLAKQGGALLSRRGSSPRLSQHGESFERRSLLPTTRNLPLVNTPDFFIPVLVEGDKVEGESLAGTGGRRGADAEARRRTVDVIAQLSCG